MSKTAQEYEYKLPEGYEMPQGIRDKLDALVTETKMDEDTAQKFIDLHVELLEEYAHRVEEAYVTEALNVRLANNYKQVAVPQKQVEYAPEIKDHSKGE